MKAMDLIRTLPLKGRVEMDIPMKELTTLRVGGKADCVVFAGSESDVEQIALFCADRDVPLTVVGRGSNLLVRDGGLSGVVLVMGKAFADVRVEKNRVYAQAGATLGALLGSVLHFDTTGIEFVMTALFTVMFVNQWEEAKDHRPALTGLGCAALCLAVFGSDGFMLPAMALIIVCFLVSSKSQKKEEPAL